MKKGTIWIIIGFLFLAGAVGLTAYNMADTVRAGKESREILGKVLSMMGEPIPVPEKYLAEESLSDEIRYPDYVLDPTREMPKVKIDEVEYVGILEIPSLEISLPVCAEWSYENLASSPCRFTGTAYQGGFVICAHNYISHFGQLKELQTGDKVFFTDMDGNCFEYEVAAQETLSPTAVEEITSDEWDLSLFTCTVGGAFRVTIRCVKK